jgi:hypothetical protein
MLLTSFFVKGWMFRNVVVPVEFVRELDLPRSRRIFGR